MTLRIRIRGSQATLHGVESGDVLPHCLAFLHPNRFQFASFRDGDWDGKVEMFSGHIFPAGLSWRVAEWIFANLGKPCEIVHPSELDPVDLQFLTEDYLVRPDKPDFRLREHQMHAVQALLENPRGIIKSPTGSGKSEVVIAGARYLYEEFGHRSLIVEPRKGVARQMRERAQLYYGGDIEVGMLGDGLREIGPVTIGTGQTLAKFKSRMSKGRTVPADPLLREVVKTFEVLWFDECHHSSSETWYSIGMETNALRRYGVSGTPRKNDLLADARLEAVTGPILYEAKPDALIDRGYAAKPKIVMVMAENATGPELAKETRVVESRLSNGRARVLQKDLPYAEAYTKGVVENEYLHAATVLATCWLVDRGRQTLVIVRRKAHFLRLEALLQETGIEFLAVWGASDNSDRDHAKAMFGSKKVQCVLATTIWDEGEDVASVDALVLGEGVKVNTSAVQRIGRGMRPDSEDLWVVDFVPSCHEKLASHAHARALSYEGEGYEVLLLEDWPEGADTPPDDLLPFESWDSVMA